MVRGRNLAPRQLTHLMQRHHSIVRYTAKILVWVFAVSIAGGGFFLPATAAARATDSYLQDYTAEEPTGGDLALDSATVILDVAPPLPRLAPSLAPVARADEPDDNLVPFTEEDYEDLDSSPSNNPNPALNPEPGDVDTRSTAFDPRDLSMLTDIDLPDEPGRWIRVDLSEQMVIAYVGDRPIRGFVVSTGLPGTPTVTGEFRIRMKVRSQTMEGGEPALGTYYNLPNVQWVQYFYADYGFHGTYWHNNFGRPMSHGCINMTNADAKWLFDWAGPTWDGKTVWYPSNKENPGTLVIVHE